MRMCDDDKTVADHIASARKEAGLSQEELSEKLYVTRQAVSNWERGRTRSSQEMIEKNSWRVGRRCGTDCWRVRRCGRNTNH